MYESCPYFVQRGAAMIGADRDFFIQIKKAITLNPFGSERARVDRELAGSSSKKPTDEELFKKLLYRVSKTLERYIKEGASHLSKLSGEELLLVRYGILFDLFHRYSQNFDDLVATQIAAGETSSPVPFAGEVIKKLQAAGYAHPDSLRMFALFYQMRRAFYFISSISGRSNCVLELKKSLWNNIFTEDLELYESFLWNRMEDFSTLLLGETGTGKGLAAASIGRSGYIPFDSKANCFKESFAKGFISINLSQYSEQIIESELFGHKKGAFTGAIDAHQGVFFRCSPHGAIFIDEIGDVSIPVQIKLLQVLQERRFTPVGSRREEKFQGRVIAATNQSLSPLRATGKFREDFYYRLCSDVIRVPSLKRRLRENPQEIEILLSFIIDRIVGKPADDLVETIAAQIQSQQPENYEWPGNIRELEQCVRQILLNGKYSWQQFNLTSDDEVKERLLQGLFSAEQLLAFYCGRLYEKYGTYEAVAKTTRLDRRTVKKYIMKRTDLSTSSAAEQKS